VEGTPETPCEQESDPGLGQQTEALKSRICIEGWTVYRGVSLGTFSEDRIYVALNGWRHVTRRSRRELLDTLNHDQTEKTR